MRTLYVTDLDGTLLTKEGRVSAYSREAINSLIDEGMLFTYATARAALSAYRAVEGLHVRLPVILYNGGLIYDFSTDKTLCFSAFSDEQKEYVLSVLLAHGIMPLVYSAEPGREHVVWRAGRESVGINRYISRMPADRLMPAYTDEGLLDGIVIYFKCIGPREQLEGAWNVLKYDPRFICIFHQETYQSDFWMEISPHEATKAAGARFLKEYLGCDRVVCFGDTSNDSDMFDVCDEAYAVGNADSWLKEKATGIIGYCEEDGVVKFLREHFRK